MSANVEKLKQLEAQWEVKNREICDLLEKLYPVRKELKQIGADIESTIKAIYDERHAVTT
jgi:hypothetical protein